MGNLLAGGCLVVAAFAWAAGIVAWLGFAVSIPLVLFGLTIAYFAARGGEAAERIGVSVLGALPCVVASWTIVASLVFAPAVARWLIFASACAHLALSMGESRDPRTQHRTRRSSPRCQQPSSSPNSLGRRTLGGQRANRPAVGPSLLGVSTGHAASTRNAVVDPDVSPAREQPAREAPERGRSDRAVTSRFAIGESPTNLTIDKEPRKCSTQLNSPM